MPKKPVSATQKAMSEKPAPYRLTAPKALEADRQTQIVDYLRIRQAQGHIAWFARVNGGKAQVIGKGGKLRWMDFYRLYLPGSSGAKGIADLVGLAAAGWFFAIEVKRPGEAVSPEQAAFLQAVRQAGGRAIVATGWEDVRRMMDAIPIPLCLACAEAGGRRLEWKSDTKLDGHATTRPCAACGKIAFTVLLPP
jgi:hypothetical protein